MIRLGVPIICLVPALLAACTSPPTPLAIQSIERQLERGSRLYQAGQLPEASSTFERAIHAAEMIDDTARLLDALLAAGASAMLLGRLDAAASLYLRARDTAQFAGSITAMLDADIALADIARQRSDSVAAIGAFRRLREQPGLSPAQRCRIDNGLALSQMTTGDLAAAETLLGHATRETCSSPPAMLANAQANLARLHLQQGRLSEAEMLARQALRIDRDILHPPAIAADHALLDEILRKAGRNEEAQYHHATAERIFQQTGQAAERLSQPGKRD